MGKRYGSRYGTATDVAASLGRPRHAASAVGGRVYSNERPPAVAAAGLQIRNLLETAALGPHKWRVALYCPICVEGGPGRPAQRDRHSIEQRLGIATGDQDREPADDHRHVRDDADDERPESRWNDQKPHLTKIKSRLSRGG